MKRDKWIIVIILAVLVTAAGFAALAYFRPGGAENPNTVIARVNDKTLTVKDFHKFDEMLSFSPDPAEREDFVNQWVQLQLLLAAAEEAGIADSEAIQWEIDRKREEIIVTALFGTLENRFNTELTDEAAAAYYTENPEMFGGGEQVKARHILVRVSPEAAPEQKEEARKKAEDIHMMLMAGADFAGLAKEKSDDTASGKEGGDLDWFGRGQMVPEFETVVFELEPGETSDVFETQFGYHIAMVEDTRVAEPAPLDENLKRRIQQQLTQEKQKELFDQYMADLKTKNTVTMDTSLIPPAEGPMMGGNVLTPESLGIK